MTFPCDLCGATDSLDTPGDPSRKIRICSDCGFVHVKERRSIQEVAQSWEQIYASGGYDPQWPGVQARLYYTAAWLDTSIGLAGKSVLDIGSGDGTFLDFCRARGAHPVGLDPSDGNVRKVKARDIACFRGLAADSSPDLGQYDIVALCWTLENCADALEVLRYAKRRLHSNGHVVVATGSRILVPFKKCLGGYLPRELNYPHDTHCFRWSYLSLIEAMRLSGIEYWRCNDWEDRDEMVLIGKPSDAPSQCALDEPTEVQDHFRRWQREFP